VQPHKPVLTFLLTADYDGNMNAEARQQHLTLFQAKESWLSRNSRLIAKLNKNAAVLSLMRSATSEVNKLKPDWADLDGRFSESLTTAVERLRASGTNIALITTAHRLRPEQPTAEQVAAAKSHLEFAPYASVATLVGISTHYNRIVRDTARKYDTMLIDDVDAIPGTAENYVDSNHFSPAGSRLMAERVTAELHRSAHYRQLVQTLDRQCGVQPHA
jgi:hypothetical protein